MFNLDVFSPYTTEVHREYVPVAGHGAWLAVLFLFFLHKNVSFGYSLYCLDEAFLMSTCSIQSNFVGSNIFGIIEFCLRQG